MYFKILVCTFVNICFILTVLAVDSEEEKREKEGLDKSGMWFGPRVGKRSLMGHSESDRRDAVLRMLEAADVMKYYYDQLPYHGADAGEPETRVTKKTPVVFTPILGRNADEETRSYEVDFTPRLGRRAETDRQFDGEKQDKKFMELFYLPRAGRRITDAAGAPSDKETMYRSEPVKVGGRSQMFSPRLGRNFTPRLGRNIVYDMYPENIRVARSTKQNATTA